MLQQKRGGFIWYFFPSLSQDGKKNPTLLQCACAMCKLHNGLLWPESQNFVLELYLDFNDFFVKAPSVDNSSKQVVNKY